MNKWEISAFGWHGLTGVYCICHDKEILYIGSSKDIGKRLSSKSHPYRLLYNSGYNVFVKYKQTNLYLELEKKLIQRLKPRFNLQHSGIEYRAYKIKI